MSEPLRSGPRVTLRRLVAADLRSFQDYRHDPALGQYQGWSPLSDEEALAFITQMNQATLFQPGAWCQLGIADRGSNELIGDVGVCVDAYRSQAEIGFTLRGQSQRRGLAAEAVREVMLLVFEHTPVDRIVGVTDARNTASVRLLERVGMCCMHTQPARFRGEPCIEHRYEVARSAPPE